MTTGCNIWMICLKLNRFFYGLSRMLHFSEFVWTLRSSAFVVFHNFLLIDATARSKISSDQKSFFIALSLHPLSFFANTPFKTTYYYSDITNYNCRIQCDTFVYNWYFITVFFIHIWVEWYNSVNLYECYVIFHIDSLV